MPNYYTYKPSLGEAAQYTNSGRPWVATGSVATSATLEIEFPHVASSISIYQWQGSIGFSADAPAENRITLKNVPTNEPPFTLEVKCRRIFLFNVSPTFARAYNVVATLTGIDDPYILSGSGINTP
jgi:hypothetical protein